MICDRCDEDELDCGCECTVCGYGLWQCPPNASCEHEHHMWWLGECHYPNTPLQISVVGDTFHMPPRTDYGTHTHWTVKGSDRTFLYHENALGYALACGQRCNEVTYHTATTFTFDGMERDEFDAAINAQRAHDRGSHER